MEDGDVEVRVEQDRHGIEDAPARRVDPHAVGVRPGDDVRVGDHVVVGDDEPGPDRREAAGRRRDLERAGLGDGRDGARRGIGRPVDRRPGQRLEADEDVGQAGVVQPTAEPDGDLGRWRQDRGQGPDRGRGAGRLGQARDRTLGQEAAGEPDDEQRLDDPEARADRPVGGAEQAVAEPAGHAAAERLPRAIRRWRPRR